MEGTYALLQIHSFCIIFDLLDLFFEHFDLEGAISLLGLELRLEPCNFICEALLLFDRLICLRVSVSVGLSVCVYL